MECALRITPSSVCLLPRISICNCGLNRTLPSIGRGNQQIGVLSFSSSSKPRAMRRALGDFHMQSSLESHFCYDKPIPEEIIEKPVGISSLAEKNVGDNPRCTSCGAKGALLCNTCSGSGLYVESILESQGIIVKVRCLGCGGTGNIMCSECGGRGHV